MRGACVVFAVVLGACGADLLNNSAIHAHVDDQLAHRRASPIGDRLLLSAGALVPILGSCELDHRVFGSVRPSAIVFDWILGGVAPAALLVASFATGDASARSALRWTALGLYGGTRIGVLVIGNLHISEYDDYLARRTRGVALSVSW
jgi:hypothetical protein